MSATSSPTLDFLTTFAATTPVAGTAAVTPESIRVRAISRAAIWSGRIITGVISVLLAMDASLKVFMLGPAVEGTMQLGYPPHLVFPLGLIEAVSLVLYLVPRTSVLGAVLWTVYLGGAVATHVRLDNPIFTHTLSPIYVAAMLWGGLWLRDRRLRHVFAKPR
jgi:hypothetical protein